ncbi:right-handed parallel beta-helix repeat-containing protein [Flavihumibacter sp. UBA7668]|uniref:right-handed parallel beta-helix repeat-containing protein n=1 Tax=Flavihumibacter sp. UBA7668 TaxID=1946542 RepID=UPI0025BC0B89|nr:right-handed parallel beta-helix repeat-containing protein [Flavihumibacter sp. UBA7668]
MRIKIQLAALVYALLSFSGLASASASDTLIHAIDFGIKPDSYENASPAIQRLLLFCKGKPGTTIQLPQGRIDLWPDGATKKELYISNGTENDTLSKIRSIGFYLEGFRNLRIIGQNTIIVLHGKMISFALLDCTNITLESFRFDYERPTMSEFKVNSFSNHQVELEVNPASRYTIENGKLILFGEGWKSNSYHTILFQPETGLMKYSSFKTLQQAVAKQLKLNNLIFTGDFSKSGWQVGDRLSVRDPYRDNVGGLIWKSTNTHLKNLTMHYMHGLGIVSQFSENITFQNVRVAPPEGSDRIISSFADCFHFSGCKGKILIDHCFTSGSHDDPINVHGTHLKIREQVNPTTLHVEFMHHQTYGIEAFFKGDSIAYIQASSLLPAGFGKVKRAEMMNKRIMELEMEMPIPAGINKEFVLENISWTPDLTIRNSHFERTNTRGILVTTRKKVVIENNRFVRTGMHAILIANDASSWYESGPVQDVLIQNNRFEECGYNSSPGNYVIAIAPENHELIPNRFVHQNIRIRNNYFKVYDSPILTARSVDGLEFSGNTIEQSDLLPKTEGKPGFQLTGCKNVNISDNKLLIPWQPLISISKMDKRTIQAKGMSIQFNQ